MSGFSLGEGRRRKRLVSLTPMIDVVFLLLVFFMLVARFAQEGATELSATAPGGGAALDGPPRLVRVEAQTVYLNGAPIAPEALGSALAALSPSNEAAVVVQAGDGATIQRLVDILDLLEAAPLGPVLLLE